MTDTEERADPGPGAPEDPLCPVCGEGRLRDLAFDEGAEQRQDADSRQVQTFTCGHEVIGAQLSSADTTRLDVEQRRSDETVETNDL